ncbi:complex I subunit 5 family protein [Halomonas qinghailakensis]|uniref:Complex I subunit 5 family protein n=1 Tax=Halomonas qinghailakensis TaxID=2937790 RepID=A0AA46TNI0_9GAMM|nr:complex I subunit 5 family protein [Halomonas sp. ZZQ-149]UYO73620.1 complex I subunit 5 family protein [Halomonas sp. ZZQ-149]
MITLLLLAALLWPLCVAGTTIWQAYRTPAASRDYFSMLWVSASWPALLLAFSGEVQWSISAWMLGGYWELNALSRPWLAFTALLWSLAAIHARGYFAAEQRKAQAGDQVIQRRCQRLALLWPLTLLGNVLLIIAQDIASFYLGFALMTFAAYALVVHSGSDEARLGARAYLILAVIGEGLILGGFLWVAGTSETLTLKGVREGIAVADHGATMALLLWLGFGVKAGVIGLHVWLPLAHPVAPAPASAVLSGAMIKAGLLAWINVLPLGVNGLSPALLQLGNVMLIAGLAAAFGAALYGVWQRHPKAVLAYSSISQMGMLTAMVAMGLAAPDVWPLLLPGVVLFTAHHALAKGALFLGTSISEHMPRWPQPLLFALIALPGVSLTGALAAGMLSKWGVKSALYDMHHEHLIMLLTWAAIGTSALISVCVWRQWQQRHSGGSNAFQWGAWLAALVAALVTPIWLPLPAGSVEIPPASEWLSLSWPFPVGVMIVVMVVVIGASLLRRVVIQAPPAGDLWWLYSVFSVKGLRVIEALARACEKVKMASVAFSLARERALMRQLNRGLFAEAWMRHHGSGLMMVFAVIVALLLMWEGLR